MAVPSDRPHRFAKGSRPHIKPAVLPVAAAGIKQGQAIGALVSDSAKARWPLQQKGWWPRPRVGDDHNATWELRRCRDCQTHAIILTAVKQIKKGSEIIVDRCCHVYHSERFTSPNFEVTFDGGAREIDGQKVAGAGAALWSPTDHNGDRQRQQRTAMALPGEKHSPVAEAWGLRVAIDLLCNMRVPRSMRTARIAGDNLAVVRFGASLGKLARAYMHDIIDEALGRLIQQGWDIEWVPIRRRFNKEADAIATFAVRKARQLLHCNVLEPTSVAVPHDADLLAA